MHVNGVASNLSVSQLAYHKAQYLGPLRFLVYMNDFPQSSAFFLSRLYADDTSLPASGPNLDNHFPAVYEWLCSNKLILNLTKTKYLIFMPRQKENYN